MRFVDSYIEAWRRVAQAVGAEVIAEAVHMLAEARARDSTVWTVGNGGGSALASHLAIGLTLNTLRAGGRPFRATCLCGDAAALSAAINDFGKDEGLRALLECNGRRGDVLCVFSASGESPNINCLVAAAKQAGIQVLAFVGDGLSTTARLSDHAVTLGSAEPGIAEDVASAVMHAIYCAFMYENAAALPSELADAT